MPKDYIQIHRVDKDEVAWISPYTKRGQLLYLVFSNGDCRAIADFVGFGSFPVHSANKETGYVEIKNFIIFWDNQEYVRITVGKPDLVMENERALLGQL